MTRSELIQILAERNPHLYLRDVEKVVDAFLVVLLRLWLRVIALNCVDLELSQLRNGQPKLVEIQNRRVC